jgi:hypothetical protein
MYPLLSLVLSENSYNTLYFTTERVSSLVIGNAISKGFYTYFWSSPTIKASESFL